MPRNDNRKKLTARFIYKTMFEKKNDLQQKTETTELPAPYSAQANTACDGFNMFEGANPPLI